MKKWSFFIFMIVAMLIGSAQIHGDDVDLFIAQVPPNALILLDMSSSMNWNTAGNPASYPNRRIDIARNVIFDLLDDDNDNKIDEKDEKSLNIRLGYMRFRDIAAYDNDDNEPKKGNIRVLSEIGSSYKDIWKEIDDPKEKDSAGFTPLAASLAKAKIYFQRDVNPKDNAIACRQKFIILITDGADTVACNGDGSEGQSDMNRRRMLTVQRAKELFDAGIKVFVVGFGATMPDHLKRTLNWAAKYGGADNPLDLNSGDPGAYDITKYGNACSVDPTNTAADPASYPLSGYAFLAEDATQLSTAIKGIINYIQEKSFSFTASAVPSVRTIDKEVVYLSSFTPKDTPFWEGSLRGYQLETDGTLKVDGDGNPLDLPIWTASIPSSRTIKTYRRGEFKDFTSSNFTKEDLDVKTDKERDDLISYVINLKLGDIFHSNGIIVGEPSRFFEDEGFSGEGGFYQANKNRTKVILVGANDGMLHAFNATTGVEEWAFVPNSLLKNLKLMLSTHTYYVDSSPKVADVWFYSNSTHVTKSADEWKTVLICGLGKGGKSYFALDITDTLNPKYLWEFPKPTDSVTLAKVGQSWSVPAIGRVKIEEGTNLVERWVAFVGGGLDPDEKRGKAASIGRAFFVIDIKTGEKIWEFSYDEKVEGKKEVTHSLPAPPTAFDTNLDGFTGKVYLGDLGGQMWVFDVSFNEADKKSQSNWTGKILFKAQAVGGEKHPIYYQPAVAFDKKRTPWVFFGTGDRENPTDKNSWERFYAVKDDGTYQRKEKDLLDLMINPPKTFAPAEKGWFIKLEKGEKVMAKPAVFNRLVYFTTYQCTDTSDPCSAAGTAKLYVLEFLSGVGALEVDDLSGFEGSPSKGSKKIGTGAASHPVITVNMKGKASVIIGTTSGQVFSTQIFSPSKSKEILYWREVIP